MIHHWGECTSIDLAELAGPDCLAVMVLGAIEQHGPHLALDTDLVIGQGLLAAALARMQPNSPVLIMPDMAIGASQEHEDFAGTLSLAPGQAMAVLESAGRALARVGIRRLVLVNAHGGNHAIMSSAALALRRCHGLLVVKASYLRFAPPTELLPAEEIVAGLHGGLAETAMMLHLAPERVRLRQTADFRHRRENGPSRPLFGPEGEASWAWLANDLNPTGVVGRADQANAELGRQLVDYYADRLAEVLRQAMAFDLVGFNPS